MERKKLLERFIKLFVIIRNTLQESSGVCHVMRDDTQERLTKPVLMYCSKFFHKCQVRNLSLWHTNIRNICHCSSGEFQMFPFLQIKQENKFLRKAYKDYFIDCFKPLLNQKGVSWVTNCGFNLTPFLLNLLPRRHQILRT